MIGQLIFLASIKFRKANFNVLISLFKFRDLSEIFQGFCSSSKCTKTISKLSNIRNYSEVISHLILELHEHMCFILTVPSSYKSTPVHFTVSLRCETGSRKKSSLVRGTRWLCEPFSSPAEARGKLGPKNRTPGQVAPHSCLQVIRAQQSWEGRTADRLSH